jgi:aromatic ring-opening dioxygenase catalytic subunit (LigB family)
MVAFLRQLPDRFPKPDAVVVISAHWEENVPTIIAGETPSLFFDYYGFPEESYELSYPAPGNPQLAVRVAGLLDLQDIPSKIDTDRGFDHGLFIPMLLTFPRADIPMIQVSLIRGLDPGKHIALGRALRPLADENILIVGSGFSFHNMRAFDWSNANRPDPDNDAFQDWLIDVCTGDHSTAARQRMLEEWSEAPHARYCHPREEHLLPLHVCYGVAGAAADVIFDDYILGKRAIALRW